MTKKRERQYVSNRDRAAIANQNHANLFIRLHCDSGPGSGFAVYYPDRMGRAFGKIGPSAAVIASSHDAALKVGSALTGSVHLYLHDNGVKGDSLTFVSRRQGALTGSIFAKVPVVTVEMCVLDNSSDAAFIKSDSGREKMAKALASGVLDVCRR